MNATKLPRPFALALSGAAALLLLSIFGVLWASPAYAQETDGDDFVDGEVVVKLNPASVATVDDINREYGTATEETLLSNAARIYLLRVTDGEDTLEKVGRMRGDARLAYAEPNYTTDAPEDSRHMRFRGDNVPQPSSDSAAYSGQYAVEALNLPQAHGVNRGAGATVAVLDTGAQLGHPELAGSLVAGYDFIGDDPDPSEEPNSVDDDGDGNTDEATGHGTHVAGIVHLTAPEAKIMPLRVLDSDGRGNVFVIAEAIQRAVDPDNDPKTDDGVDVINMSLSSSRESNLIRDVSDDLDADDDDDDDDDETGPALRGVPTNGVTVVGSAGNDNAEQPGYPAAETGVIGVASVDQDETKSNFSNYYGSPEVDVSAPGDDIYSTFTEGRYAEWDGTSMAAPFVAGQAALIRSMRPDLPSTGPQGKPSVSEFITTTARPLDAKNPDYSGKLGAGLADVYRSTLRANTAPTITQMSPAPGSRTRDRTPLLAVTVGDAQADLAEDNVRLSIDGRRTESFSYDTNTDRLSFTARRLSHGYHKAKVRASDAQGATATKTWGFRVVR